MFNYESKKSEVSLFVLRSLVFVLMTLGCVFNVQSSPDAKTVEVVSQAVLELKQANPNVEITNEMIEKELRRKSNQEELLLKKDQQQLERLKAKNRALERGMIEKAIKSNNTMPLQRLIEDKYKISSFEALDIIKRHDERAYIVLREIIMNSKD
jgi:phosphoglycerate-specific signal transduction histidine kinase